MTDSGFTGLAAALSTRNSKNKKACMPNLKLLVMRDNGLTDKGGAAAAFGSNAQQLPSIGWR